MIFILKCPEEYVYDCHDLICSCVIQQLHETIVSTVQSHIMYSPLNKNVIQISLQMQYILFEILI